MLSPEPLAAALQVTKQVHIQPDLPIAVIGDGRLAYQVASVLRLTGANLTVIGKHPEKFAQFESFGRTMTIEQAENLADQALESGEGSYEIVVEACGAPSGLELAAKIVRKQGTIVLKSTYAGKTNVDMSFYAVNEITIKGSRCGPFDPALRLLEQGLVKLPPVEFYELEDYEKAFGSRAFKAGFRIGK